MRLKKQSNEVIIADERIVRLSRLEIEAMEAALALSERGRSRICAHGDSTEVLHEMIIILSGSSYIRPHKHFAKSESFHIVQGELDVVIFDEQGSIADVVPMGCYGSDRNFFYRMADPLFHTVIVRTDKVIFHETTNGPFKREETVFAPWSPEESDIAAVPTYVRQLKSAVERFMESDKVRGD